MNRNRQETGQPRAVYDGKPNGPGATTRVVAIPEQVMAAGPNVTMAWAMLQSGMAPIVGLIDDEALRQVVVNRDDARAALRGWRCTIIGGPEEGYDGQRLFDLLRPGHEAVSAEINEERCVRYVAALQARRRLLEQAVASERKAAEERAYEIERPYRESYTRQLQQRLNSRRAPGDMSSVPRPERVEPDLSDVRQAQKRIDDLDAEINAVLGRKAANGRIVGEALTRLAEAHTRLLYLGPIPVHDSVRELDDWRPMVEASELVASLCGQDTADEWMAAAEAHWR